MDCPNCGHSGADQVEYQKPCRRCGGSEHTKRADERSPMPLVVPAGVEVDVLEPIFPADVPEFSVDPLPPLT